MNNNNYQAGKNEWAEMIKSTNKGHTRKEDKVKDKHQSSNSQTLIPSRILREKDKYDDISKFK